MKLIAVPDKRTCDAAERNSESFFGKGFLSKGGGLRNETQHLAASPDFAILNLTQPGEAYRLEKYSYACPVSLLKSLSLQL